MLQLLWFCGDFFVCLFWFGLGWGFFSPKEKFSHPRIYKLYVIFS